MHQLIEKLIHSKLNNIFFGGKNMPAIVHFDIPVDNLERAKRFYSELFDWKIEEANGYPDYFLIETENLNGETGIGGGMGKRGSPEQKITNYIEVTDLEEYVARVEAFGGKVLNKKLNVPGRGIFAICMDPEENTFCIWETNEATD